MEPTAVFKAVKAAEVAVDQVIWRDGPVSRVERGLESSA